MKDKTQEEFAYVELLSEAMKRKGWKAAALSRASGVSEGVISQTLKGGRNLTGVNLLKMLSALGVISTTNDLDKEKKTCILPELYTEKNRGIHDQIEIILNSGNEWAINFLTWGVDQITKKVRDEDEMRDQLSKLTDVVAHVVDRLDSIESNLAESGTEKGVAL